MTTCTPAQARAMAKILEDTTLTGRCETGDALRSLADQLEEAQLKAISDFGQWQEASEKMAALEADALAYRYLRDVDDWAAFCPEWLGAMGIYGKGAHDMDAAIAAARSKL